MQDDIYFKDRTEAGRMLATRLKSYIDQTVVIYGLPRGGVIVAAQVAQFLKKPIDLVIPRKIGHPLNPEYAIGAISEDGQIIGNNQELTNANKEWLKQEVENAEIESKRRRLIYLKDKSPFDIKDKIAIIVDDGIATGFTMLAAIRQLKAMSPKKIIVAVPVSPADTAAIIKKEVDEFVAVEIPQFYLGAVSGYYEHFPQVTDEEVVEIISRGGIPPIKDSNEQIEMKIDFVSLTGNLVIPDDATSLVIFAHGSGSSRLSPRNQYIASALQSAGFATLLFDLLTREEDQFYENRFDTDLISSRLVKATQWLMENNSTKDLNLGYFGASTGAAAALRASLEFDDNIKAIVCRGGRPDLVLNILPQVKSPTLFVVGGHDEIVIDLNEKAFEKIVAQKDFRLIPGATHLFEEPGALEMVAEEAIIWFSRYLE